jgi:hypothetical protein
MEITLSKAAPATLKTGVLVVGAFADGWPEPAAELVDEALGGMLSAATSKFSTPTPRGGWS